MSMKSMSDAITEEIDQEILGQVDQRFKNLDRVEETWKELGCRIRPLRDMVFVRTELRPHKEGLIWLPPKSTSNYDGLAHQVFMRALVLAVGPKCKFLKSGDRVAFTRLFFARYERLNDGSLVGWLHADNIQAEDLQVYDYTPKEEAVSP